MNESGLRMIDCLAPARELKARLAYPPAPGSFSDAELEGIPDPVHCYLGVSIAHGTPLADAARFRMNGTIKLGQRWVRFRASQIEAPHHGRAVRTTSPRDQGRHRHVPMTSFARS